MATRFVRCGAVFVCLLVGETASAAPPDKVTPHWQLPDAHDVQMGGRLGEAYRLGVERLSLDPYRSVVYLRSDLSFEMKRSFTNYSGDISGRFLEIASLTSPPGSLTPETLPELLRGISRYQKADGHLGREIDWNMPLEPESSDAVILPVHTPEGDWKVTMKQTQEESQAIVCRVRIDPMDEAPTNNRASSPPPVFLRKPDWAERVIVINRQGDSLPALPEKESEKGYVRLPLRAGAQGELSVTFTFTPRLEDRRMQRVALDPHGETRHRGVVVCNGPWVLLAAATEPCPVVVLATDQEGRLTLPKAGPDGHPVVPVASMEAAEQQIRTAMAAERRLRLAPWHQLSSGDDGAALVFDVIVRPKANHP